MVLGVNSWGDGDTCGTIRRKNAGYIADLTRPGINAWVCPFASVAWSKFVGDECTQRSSRGLPWQTRTSRPPLPSTTTDPATGAPRTSVTDQQNQIDVSPVPLEQPTGLDVPVHQKEPTVDPLGQPSTSVDTTPIKLASQVPSGSVPVVTPLVPRATGRAQSAAASSTPILFQVVVLAAAALVAAA